MDIAPYGEAIAKVSDLVSNILKRVLPAKMDEAEAAKLSNEVTLELMKGDLQQIMSEYADRASARVLAAADVANGNWFTTVMSATVRPVFGYVVMAAFVASWVPALIPGGQNFVVITDIQKDIMLSVIYFYFGGRTVEKGMALWAKMQEKK